MPKVIARQCRYTGKIFSIHDIDGYADHLKEVRRENTLNRQHANAKANISAFQRELAEFGTFQQILDHIVRNQERVFDLHEAFYHNSSYKRGVKSSKPLRERVKIVSLSVDRMRYNDKVSNSHNAPFNGETNWGRNKEGVPTSYPGFRGNIVVKFEDRHTGFEFSNMMTMLGICTGSGGGGGNKLSYDVIFWSADFPALAKKIRHDKINHKGGKEAARKAHNQKYIFKKLKGEYVPRFTYPAFESVFEAEAKIIS